MWEIKWIYTYLMINHLMVIEKILVIVFEGSDEDEVNKNNNLFK